MAQNSKIRICLALMFYPRGGSSHAVRAQDVELRALGVDTTLISGSYGPKGDGGHAESFYKGSNVVAVDYTEGLNAPDPATTEHPIMASYEDKPGAADRIFMAIDDVQYERMVAHWMEAFTQSGIATMDVIHLNHLTPMHEAALRLKERDHLTNLHVVTTLHGTDMLMLEQYQRGEGNWPYAKAWAERMKRWLDSSELVCVVSQSQIDRARALWPEFPEAKIRIISHGVDMDNFKPTDYSEAEQRNIWRKYLVEQPKGWKPGEQPGSLHYTENQIERLVSVDRHDRCLITHGRFTEIKDLPIMLDAYKEAKQKNSNLPPLVLIGGYPGEYEGRHPYEYGQSIGLVDGQDMFFTGWLTHDDMPALLNLASMFIMTSRRELFGLVAAEAMACGMPAIVTNGGGQADVVLDGVTGLHVNVGAPHEVAQAIEKLFSNPQLRAQMAEAALKTVKERYSWAAQMQLLVNEYRRLVG